MCKSIKRPEFNVTAVFVIGYSPMVTTSGASAPKLFRRFFMAALGSAVVVLVISDNWGGGCEDEKKGRRSMTRARHVRNLMYGGEKRD